MSETTHEVTYCSCGAVIRQCRCRGPHKKTIVQDGCSTCSRYKEKTMFKHANTMFPGDTVREVSTGKTAGEGRRGKVADGDPDSGKVKVAFEDGSTDWKSPEELIKEG